MKNQSFAQKLTGAPAKPSGLTASPIDKSAPPPAFVKALRGERLNDIESLKLEIDTVAARLAQPRGMPEIVSPIGRKIARMIRRKLAESENAPTARSKKEVEQSLAKAQDAGAKAGVRKLLKGKASPYDSLAELIRKYEKQREARRAKESLDPIDLPGVTLGEAIRMRPDASSPACLPGEAYRQIHAKDLNQYLAQRRLLCGF